MTAQIKYLRRSVRLGKRFSCAWFLLFMVRIRLALFGYSSLQRDPVSVCPEKAGINPEVVAKIIERVAKFVPGALCLAQAITAQRQLAKMGYKTTIRIGVKAETTAYLEAHAWLIYQDKVILGGAENKLADYKVMSNIDSASV